MAKILLYLLNGFHKCTKVSNPGYSTYRSKLTLTPQEVTAALRPFYFAVHPDLFWQFPKEKEINENSLKQLNSYLETVLQNLPPKPVSVTFCLKNSQNDITNGVSFRKVSIQLLDKDLHHTVHNILSTCQLPTEYLDVLYKSKPVPSVPRKQKIEPCPSPEDVIFESMWWKEAKHTAEEIKRKIRNEPHTNLRSWLSNNVDEARHKQRLCQPVREETERLCTEIKQRLGLKDIIWNCGWGISHFRGCLQSFRGLIMQHPSELLVLKGRTLVFGKETGVSFEGHIILSSEDVRNNWLDMIKNVDHYNDLLAQIPSIERSLSEVLRDINVDHRKFQPTIMVQKYMQQLRKLTSALYKYKWTTGYPQSWPSRLDKFQIVVECESGPLMLSPTGQFIVPASCPASLLVDFISENMDEASDLLHQYSRMKSKESKIHSKCMAEFGLNSLEKDDNITPDRMVMCCEQILNQSSIFSSYLRDLRLRISNYYSVLQDGEMCIPWDWQNLKM